MAIEPKRVGFTKDHEWLRLEADGSVVIGITNHAQQELGDVVFVQLPEVGTQAAVGEEVAVIESVKAAGGINLPLAGTVLEVNGALVDSPGTVNEDPMGAGWFLRLKPANAADLDGLMDQAAYQAYLKAEG